MIEKRLGKIESVEYGLIRGFMLGIDFTFKMDGSGIGSGGCYSFNMSEHTEHCTWTIEERNAYAITIQRQIKEWLSLAKVTNVSQLKNVPIEVTMENRTFKEFRILTEVL